MEKSINAEITTKKNITADVIKGTIPDTDIKAVVFKDLLPEAQVASGFLFRTGIKFRKR